MNRQNNTQVSGIFPLSFGQACLNFNFLIGEESQFLEQIKVDEWYPLEEILNIFNLVKEKYSDPAPIFEQIGIEMMNLWYLHGPGKNIIKRGIEFLHFQTSSEGYYSVIRGNPDQIGEFSLLNLDEGKGTATVRSTTQFNRDMERGVLIGGLRATKDLVYVHVDNTVNEDIFQIQFQDFNHIQKKSIEIPEKIDVTNLYWNYKMLENDFKRYDAFWNSTNKTLSQVFEKLENQDGELRKRTTELMQTNALLNQEIAERKRAEDALQESESEMRALFAGMPDVVIMLDHEGRYLKIAPTSPELLFKPEEELRGKSLHEIFPKEQADMFLEHVQKSLATQQLVNLEYNLNIGGTELWFEGRLAPMQENMVVFVARDITPRKLAYKELSENEKRYRMLFELSPNGLLLEDMNGVILDVNPSFCNSIGYLKKELLGKHVNILVHPDALNDVEKNINQLKKGKILRHHEKSLRKDGSMCYMDLHELKVSLPDNKEGILCIAEDITERRKAEEELRESEVRFRGLSDATFEGILIHDDGQIIDGNQVLVKMFGYQRSEAMGKNILDFLAPTTHKKVQKWMKQKDETPYESEGITKDGLIFPLEIQAKIMPYQGNDVWVVAVRDLTVRKAMEEEKNRLQKESFDFRMETLGFVTHELKSPLATMETQISVMLKGYAGEVPENISNYLIRIRRSCEELQDMVKNYLDMSRMGMGELEAKKGPANYFKDIVEPSIEQTKILFESRGITLNIDCRENLIVLVDHELIRIALTNYLTNAAKYGSENKQARLEVSEEDGIITTSVWNEGTGFRPEEQASLFSKFSRLKNENTAKKRGSGLGLYLIKNIIKQHHGKVWAESNPGKWAKFCFSFPENSEEKVKKV